MLINVNDNIMFYILFNFFFIIAGTKECYDGPLELLKLIRQALSDIPLPTPEDLKKSIPDGPGDIPQTNRPSSTSNEEPIEKKEERKNDMKIKQ